MMLIASIYVDRTERSNGTFSVSLKRKLSLGDLGRFGNELGP